MRKRPILLAAAAVAAGLAALGTVGAQIARRVRPTKAPTNRRTAVRPNNEWSPTPPGGVKSAGGYLPPAAQSPQGGNRPRITTAVVAGPDGVRPVGAELPPPNMDAPPALACRHAAAAEHHGRSSSQFRTGIAGAAAGSYARAYSGRARYPHTARSGSAYRTRIACPSASSRRRHRKPRSASVRCRADSSRRK